MVVAMMRNISNISVRFVPYIRLKQVSIRYIREMNQNGVLIYQALVQ